MKVQAILKKQHNDKTGRSEYALVSRKSGRVLRWFGTQKPSDERVQKEERRVQYFKNHGSYQAIRRVLAAAPMLGYKVMRYQDGRAVSGADSRQGFELQRGAQVQMSGHGIYMSLGRQYVLDHYAGHDQNVLITFEFDPDQITAGNITDRETEFAVPSAVIKDFEILPEEIESITAGKEERMIILSKRRYPALARVLAVPIDIEGPRKNFDQSRRVAEKKIEEIQALVKKDLEDFARQYKQASFRKTTDKEGKDTKEYRFDRERKKEIYKTGDLAVEDRPGKPAQPGQPKGYDEGTITLYSKNPTLAPGVEHESGGEGEGSRGYDRHKAIWLRIGFSWEETEDPENPKIFWWEGEPTIIKDPAKEEWTVKRKHEYKDYAEIEKYMNRRLNLDEIIRDTSEQHMAGIQAKAAPLLEEVRNILKPLLDKPIRFANYPVPVKPEMKEWGNEGLKEEDQTFSFKILANPKKDGYEAFNVFYVSLSFGGGYFHTPYELKSFDQYFSSDFDLKSLDEYEDNFYSPIDQPDFSMLKKLVAEILQDMKRKVPVLEVDEDALEEEPKQLEAPEEEAV